MYFLCCNFGSSLKKVQTCVAILEILQLNQVLTSGCGARAVLPERKKKRHKLANTSISKFIDLLQLLNIAHTYISHRPQLLDGVNH